MEALARTRARRARSAADLHAAGAARLHGSGTPWPLRRRRGASCRNTARSAAGILTRPSASRLFSRIAARTRGTARPEPLSVCTSSALPGLPRAEADLRAARLERLEIRAARHLEPPLLARRPDLEVVFLRLGEPEIAPAHEQHAVRDLELPQERSRRRPAARPAPRSSTTGWTHFRSSTLSNWCTRLSPRTSLP